MKKTSIILLAAATLAGALWWLLHNGKTNEELIADSLDAMAAACSKRTNENAVGIAMKNSEISNLMAPTCSVSINEAMIDGTFQPLEFAGQVTRGRTLFSTISGSIDDIDVKVASNGGKATVEYSVKVCGTIKKSGKSFDESRDLTSKMVKIDGKWKFASFEVREVLEK